MTFNILKKGSLPVLLLTTAMTPVSAEESDQLVLDEILVTAERRTSTVQDAPIAITAVSGESLQESSIFDTESLSYSVPGLIIQRDVVGKAVIRGIGTENFTVGGDPGVANYVDGAYIARSSTAIFDFFDVERVEVLRGPQGTLYGRNATGGVINVISKAPSEEFEFSGSLTVGNYEAIRAEAAVSGPLSDNVRVRLAGLINSRQGFTENIFPGIEARGLDRLDSKDLFAIRARVDVDLSERFTLELIGDLYRDDSNPPAFWYTDDSLPWQSPTSVFPRDLRTVSQGYEAETPGVDGLEVGQANRQDQTGITVRMTWEGDDFTIISTTAYRDIEFDWINDGDGLSDFLVVYFQRDESEQFTQELQINSTTDGPFQWIAGAFYLNEDSEGLYAIPLGPAFGASTIAYDGTNQTEAFGVFVEGTYTWDRLSFTAGIRYSDETKDATLDFSFFPLFTLDPQEQSASFNAFTPRFVLDYQVSDDVSVYASITRGFKSGGFSLLDNPINAFDEEFIWAYEVGLKSEFMERRGQFNTSVFYYDYTDQQLSQVTNLATQTTNAGSSTIWGIEAEFKYLITANLLISANAAYLDTEFDIFCTNDTRNPALPIDAANCGDTPNLAGNELPRSPGFTANIAAAYERPISNDLIGFARIEWQHTGSQFFSVFNRPNIAQDAVNVLNASLGISDADGKWSVRAWARNLTDEEYFSNVFESGVLDNVVVPQGFVAPPATFGLTVSFNY